MVKIETQEALGLVDDIAPLVDVLFVGPFDLGNNIGHPVIDGKIVPELNDAIKKILEATNKAGKRAGIYCTSGEQAKYFADMGFHMIHLATDITALQAVLADTLAIAKGETKPEKAGSY
jgi:4-hydroxy-2-oxoheptanedioate aldolase